MTKIQTLEAYKEMNFEEVIPMTWFCHHPKNGEPCGLCSPCVQAMRSDFSFRIPVRSRLNYYLFRTTYFGSIVHKAFKRLSNNK